jgi:Large polyvalent protein-associated domain 7
MDDAIAHLGQGSPVSGGAVEPGGRKAAEAIKIRLPALDAVEHFELRDPFAEVIYSARNLEDMATKAEQLGAHRFVAIGANGERSFVEQDNGEWQRRPAVVENREGYPEVVTHAKAKPDLTAKKSPDTPALTKRRATQTSARAAAAAERAARMALLESALQERYIIKRAPLSLGDVQLGNTEYRFRGNSSRVAFTESTFKLVTDTNSPSVARSMVDVAQARNWSALRVSGHADFKRLVWLEASVRGVKAIGYEPNPADLEVLRREKEVRQVNRIDMASTAAAPVSAEKPSGRGSGGRKAVLAAIEAVLVGKGVKEAHRLAVISSAKEQLEARLRAGRSANVQMYDKASAPHRVTPRTHDDSAMTLERTSPTR